MCYTVLYQYGTFIMYMSMCTLLYCTVPVVHLQYTCVHYYPLLSTVMFNCLSTTNVHNDSLLCQV